MDSLLILLVALALDLILGDPPTRYHPVGWMGRLISIMVRFAPRRSRSLSLCYGLFMVLVVAAICVTPVYFLLDYLDQASRIAYIIISALLLKSVFSVRGLYRSAAEVKTHLENNAVADARDVMPSLVSREPGKMDERQLVAATVESIAENTSDSFVAPLFWFLVLGVPGAVGYRVINTFDSMVGYRGRYEYLGKFASRLDDVLNLIPARLTGLMVVIAAGVRKKANASWRIMLRDHARTESPNAGWPMSAAAGALGVRLSKEGCYELGDDSEPLNAATIGRMLLVMCLVAAVWSLLCLGIEGVKFALAS